MIISKIKRKNIVYYNLHAEQCVTGIFIDGVENGVFIETLTKKTIDRILKDFGIQKKIDLILDFSNITIFPNNQKYFISTLKGNSKRLTLINVTEEIITKTGVDVIKNYNNIKLNKKYKNFFVFETGSIKFNEIHFFEQTFVEYLEVHCKEPESGSFYHTSSSVYLTKYIDVKSMISDKKGFFIFSIYKLALKIKKHWLDNIEKEEKPILICQNLNSAYITSVLSSFLDLELLIFDKLGPIDKLYSTLDKKIIEGKSYIVVSDLVCLGTEIKISKNLITFLGGKYKGNVSIIRIKTLHSETKTYEDTECVFELTKDNNVIDYQILTALNTDN